MQHPFKKFKAKSLMNGFSCWSFCGIILIFSKYSLVLRYEYNLSRITEFPRVIDCNFWFFNWSMNSFDNFPFLIERFSKLSFLHLLICVMGSNLLSCEPLSTSILSFLILSFLSQNVKGENTRFRKCCNAFYSKKIAKKCPRMQENTM